MTVQYLKEFHRIMGYAQEYQSFHYRQCNVCIVARGACVCIHVARRFAVDIFRNAVPWPITEKKVTLLSEPRLDLIFKDISKLDRSQISCIHMSTIRVSSILRFVHHRKAYARNMKLNCHTMSALSSIVIHMIVIMC